MVKVIGTGTGENLRINKSFLLSSSGTYLRREQAIPQTAWGDKESVRASIPVSARQPLLAMALWATAEHIMILHWKAKPAIALDWTTTTLTHSFIKCFAIPWEWEGL